MNNRFTYGRNKKLRAHFAFTKIPFNKFMWAKNMFDSTSQRDLRHALNLWTEISNIALVTGPSGVGKSISLRRFFQELDENRFRVFELSYLPSTVFGFLRSLNRTLDLPMRQHAADIFDAAQRHLNNLQQEQGFHPILFIDDAEGLQIPVLDVLRRLTCHSMDSQETFSILIAGTEQLLPMLRHSSLDPLRSRIGYAHVLRPFNLEDTQNYVRYHMERSSGDKNLFSDDAVKALFQASQGRPRNINQIAMQSLIQAAVNGRDIIDGAFMTNTLANHPLYQNLGAEKL